MGVSAWGLSRLQVHARKHFQQINWISSTTPHPAFVHEFRPLGVAEIRRLLAQSWVPSGVKHPPQPWADDAIATIIRITSGNFRLLNRLLTQMERILEINGVQEITKTVVETARETLVIGVA